MPINITTAGQTGAHSFSRVNVNTDDDYLYFNSNRSQTIPAGITDGTGYLYSDGTGSIGNLANQTLVFADVSTGRLDLTDAVGGSPLNLTFADTLAGTVTFNTPVVYDNKLNIDASTSTNQAVKYYTNSTPLTGLVSGNTYFLKNVSVSSFAGSQALYSIASNTHTFTTCGQTGRSGPIKAQMNSAYAAAAWAPTYIQQGAFQGYQDWTVPVSGIYQFTVSGASM